MTMFISHLLASLYTFSFLCLCARLLCYIKVIVGLLYCIVLATSDSRIGKYKTVGEQLTDKNSSIYNAIG